MLDDESYRNNGSGIKYYPQTAKNTQDNQSKSNQKSRGSGSKSLIRKSRVEFSNTVDYIKQEKYMEL